MAEVAPGEAGHTEGDRQLLPTEAWAQPRRRAEGIAW